MKKTKKILIIIIGILLLGFIVLNLLWYLQYAMYKAFQDKMERVEIAGEVVYTLDLEDGKFHCSVKTPDYLSFSGNLAITRKNEEVENQNSILIIWASKYKATTYGVMLYDDDENGTMHEIMIDADGVPVFEEDDTEEYINKINSIIENNKDVVEELLNTAHSVWSFE